MAFIKTISTNVRKYRKMRSISQATLAEMCNTSTSYIGSLETGKNKPKIATLEKIAKALNVPIEQFFLDPISGIGRQTTLEDKLVNAIRETIVLVLHNEGK
ncbi:MAG: helix-turn-helix domain-containing protein [Desulfovibrionaceae bacterium]